MAFEGEINVERGREFFIVSLCRTVSQIGLFFAPLLNSGLHLKFEGKAEVVQMLLFFQKIVTYMPNDVNFYYIHHYTNFG